MAAGGLIYLRHCAWNPEQAAEYATENAEKKSVGMCALYVRKAINAGGIPLWRCGSEVGIGMAATSRLKSVATQSPYERDGQDRLS